MPNRIAATLFLVAFAATGCSTTGSGDSSQAATLLGREGDVRIQVQMFTRELTRHSAVSIKWEIENLRAAPIAFADLIPVATFDAETLAITVHLGSEVPGNELVPRLVLIRSGESRPFEGALRLDVGSRDPIRVPQTIRVRANYLENPEPFRQLIDLSERAIHDPQLADALFLPWVDNNRIVTTNEIPVQWSGREDPLAPATTRQPPRRRP